MFTIAVYSALGADWSPCVTSCRISKSSKFSKLHLYFRSIRTFYLLFSPDFQQRSGRHRSNFVELAETGFDRSAFRRREIGKFLSAFFSHFVSIFLFLFSNCQNDLTELTVATISSVWQKVKFVDQRVSLISVMLDLASQSFSKVIELSDVTYSGSST